MNWRFVSNTNSWERTFEKTRVLRPGEQPFLSPYFPSAWTKACSGNQCFFKNICTEGSDAYSGKNANCQCKTDGNCFFFAPPVYRIQYTRGRAYRSCIGPNPLGYVWDGKKCVLLVGSTTPSLTACEPGYYSDTPRGACRRCGDVLRDQYYCPGGYQNPKPNRLACPAGTRAIRQTASDVSECVLPSAKPLVVLAHAVNTLAAVDWAMRVGANGVEMDLRFGAAQDPLQISSRDVVGPNDVLEFRHSQYKNKDGRLTYDNDCDCSYASNTCQGDRGAKENNVCQNYGQGPESCTPLALAPNTAVYNWAALYKCHPCIKRAPAAAMMEKLASYQDRLAVVYLDSKIDIDDKPTNLSLAGQNVVAFTDTNLFGNGYRGQVVVSCPSKQQLEYLRGVQQALENSAFRGNYYLTIDGQSSIFDLSPANCLFTGVQAESNYFYDVANALRPLTKNRIYSTGITTYIPCIFKNQMALAGYNVKSGSLSSAGIWTLDSPTSMAEYLYLNSGSIMTNCPATALDVVRSKKDRGYLATPGSAFQPAQNDNTVQVSYEEPCWSNGNCVNNACGRFTFDSSAPLQCCPRGETYFTNYNPFQPGLLRDFCTGTLSYGELAVVHMYFLL